MEDVRNDCVDCLRVGPIRILGNAGAQILERIKYHETTEYLDTENEIVQTSSHTQKSKITPNGAASYSVQSWVNNCY